MGKTRNVFITVVLNIFLMLMTSVLLEYNSLAERFSMLENNVQVSLDTALRSSTASEEFFTSGYQEYMASNYWDSDNLSVGAVCTLYRNNEWFQANTYALGMFYDENGRLPNSSSEYSSFTASNGLYDGGTLRVYEYLFGQAGESYSDGNLSWGNKSLLTYKALADTHIDSVSRKPRNKFLDYYNHIGKEIKVEGLVKEKSGDTFNIITKEYSVLDNMGLNFGGTSFTRTDTNYLTDNFCMSFHAGKSIGGQSTVYFLTPRALRVTYVPVEVLKPVFMGNLDTLARLQKLSSGSIGMMDDATIKNVLNSADDCILPSVYTGANLTQEEHIKDVNRNIVTDGSIEYGLDTVQIRCDYFVVDLFDEANKDIVAKVKGAMSGYDGSIYLGKSQSELLSDTVENTIEADTSNNADGKSIVAKVTVRMKVYICYESPILQWVNHNDYVKGGLTNDLHYSIRNYTPTSGDVERSSDGTWYQYSTYYTVAR